MTDLLIACPHCGRNNNRHRSDTADKQRPNDGDVSVCWGCRRLAIYVTGPLGVSLRVPTADERGELEADPRIRAALGAMAESYVPDEAVDLWRLTQGGGR